MSIRYLGNYTHTQIHSHSTLTHTHTHTQAHTYTHNTRRHSHTHTHTRTHTHTQTHTRSLLARCDIKCILLKHVLQNCTCKAHPMSYKPRTSIVLVLPPTYLQSTPYILQTMHLHRISSTTHLSAKHTLCLTSHARQS